MKLVGLKKALREAGITEDSSVKEVEQVKKAYWREYHRQYEKRRGKRSGKRLTIRMSITEHEELKKVALSLGVKNGLAKLLKEAGLRSLLENGYVVEQGELLKLHQEVRRIGNEISKVVQKLQLKVVLSKNESDSATFLQLKSAYSELMQRVVALEKILIEKVDTNASS